MQVDVVMVGAVVIVCVDVVVWAVGDGHLEQLARTVSLVGWQTAKGTWASSQM